MAHDAKIYVLDTFVLLPGPRAMTRFDEYQVVLPVVVITELEGKRHHPELGYFARKTLHVLDELRVISGRLDQSIPVGSRGDALRVELGLTKDTVLPNGMRLGDNDTKILAVTAQLATDHDQVTLVTKGLPMRIKASSAGLNTEDYRGRPHTAPDVYQSMVYGGMGETDMAGLYRDSTASPGSVMLIRPPVEGAGNDSTPVESLDQDAYSGEAAPQLGGQPVRTGVILTSQRGSALATLDSDELLHVVRTDRELFGVRGRSAEQHIAMDHLVNPGIGIVSLENRAGTGKSALTLAAEPNTVVERREHRRVLVFRPIYAVGGQTLEYLPGSGGDEMNPWSQTIFDTPPSIVSPEAVEEAITRGLLEVLSSARIRGRSLHGTFVIIDEAQSLKRNVLLTMLSRMGQNAKVVLTHGVSQRDNLWVRRFDGITAVIEDLKGPALSSYTTLMRSERSMITDLITNSLDH